ncbi:MAG TPA: hypothetical protein VK861_05585 [Bacteroidales bacterium]|nr:hypothetical protein [Bacteroidales bacterium]
MKRSRAVRSGLEFPYSKAEDDQEVSKKMSAKGLVVRKARKWTTK